MINISFISKTPDPFGEIIKEVNVITEEQKTIVTKLGLETVEKMRAVINDGKVRPQSDEPTALENAIDIEYFENGWGVGDIEKLKQSAPGWAAVNFGSNHMVGRHLPLGTFNPGEPAPTDSFFRVGRWKKGEEYQGKKYSPIVKKSIPPMNYIEKTVFWLANKFAALTGL